MRKTIISLLGYALMACLTGNSCRKSDDGCKCPTIPNGPDCQPIPESNSLIGYEDITEGRHLRTASCNPNNNDELVFWASGSQYTSQNNDTLFVYNKATGLTQKILVASIGYPPQWGRNGWILLGLAGGNLAMIKPNGDSLTDISQGRGNYHHPAWNASCTRIYAYSFDGPNVLLNMDGTVADSFRVGAEDVEFIDDNHFLARVGIYTISTHQYDRIVDAPQHNFLGSRMISSDEIIWANNTGIYKTSVSNRQTATLKTYCNSQTYLSASANGSKTRVFWTLVKSRGDTCGADKLYEDYEIVEMNIDGTEERELPIPE